MFYIHGKIALHFFVSWGVWEDQGLSDLDWREIPYLISYFIWWAIVEESAFRLPIFCVFSIVFYLSESLLKAWRWALAASVISSVFFGLSHGSWPNLFLQGIGGFLLCLMIFKFGAWRGKLVKPFSAAVVIHSFYNLAVTFFP